MKNIKNIEKYTIISLENKILPKKGISERIKISSFGKEAAVFPINGSPIRPVKAVANIVSPSPVATWLVIRVIVKNEKIKLINIPARAPNKMPIYGLPKINTDPRAATAPHNIIPSTPRFKTPLFSVTSSPRPAKRIGIDVRRIVMIKFSINYFS